PRSSNRQGTRLVSGRRSFETTTGLHGTRKTMLGSGSDSRGCDRISQASALTGAASVPTTPAPPVSLVGADMTWGRIQDSITDHYKILLVGPLGLAIQIRAICYCSRHLTNGLIPTPAVHEILRGIPGQDWPERMRASGLWEACSDGWIVHDYLSYNRSEAEVEATSNQKRTAGLKGGIISGLRRKQKPKQTPSTHRTTDHLDHIDQIEEQLPPLPPKGGSDGFSRLWSEYP